MYSTYTCLFIWAMIAHTAFAQSTFHVNSGATLTLNGATLTLSDTKLTNHGTVEAAAGSTVLLKGTATTANSSISGTGTTLLAHLTIDKSSNDAQIDQNLSILGDLTMTSGNLKLNAGNITFTGAGQIVGETNAKRIYGTGGELLAMVTLNAPTNVNPANLGASITSPANLGSTTVKRGHTIYTVTGSSIARYYDINPTLNTGLNATLQVYYQPNELNGNAEANLNLWRSTNTGTNWTNQGKTTLNTTDHWIALTGIDAFSRWTVAATGALPIALLDFKGRNTEIGNLLTWITSSEKDNKYFDIERSVDGKGFHRIGQVQGNNKPSTYQYIDNQPFPITYYRLQQVDLDGKFEYSKVVSVESNGNGLRVYPTLASDGVLTVQGGQSDDCIVTNLLGQPVWMGKTTQQLDVSMLPKGTYLLKVGSEVTKFVKQ